MAESGVKGFESGKKKGRCWDLILRTTALAFTLTAAVLLGVNKQTKLITAQPFPTLPPMTVPLTAKWHYLSAFIFFVVANSIASGYAAISLIPSFLAKKRPSMAVIVLDLLMVGLLFSSIGAAGAIGIIGQKGNDHVKWNKVCNVFDKFCHQVIAAIALSFIGSLAFFLLVVLAAHNLHKKSH
ncbi:CASP-like protein 1E2 [Impatiens glandulifera]|uniref:CASP-like protein 1E2 n=1 Tax=Impatiens glandulifera TaxID=253017 RepID=UPI001FB16B9B|nr:CASP-like protein 1E2 [Impatiens glandulifera]